MALRNPYEGLFNEEINQSTGVPDEFVNEEALAKPVVQEERQPDLFGEIMGKAVEDSISEAPRKKKLSKTDEIREKQFRAARDAKGKVRLPDSRPVVESDYLNAATVQTPIGGFGKQSLTIAGALGEWDKISRAHSRNILNSTEAPQSAARLAPMFFPFGGGEVHPTEFSKK